MRNSSAVNDPDTGHLIRDAQVAEAQFSAFTSRRPVSQADGAQVVRDQTRLDEPSSIWRHHPFLTDSTQPTAQADIAHRRHAFTETIHSDLIDGPLARMLSGRFPANSAWAICAAICHNLLRAACTRAGGKHAVARGATLRRHLVTIPARLAQPARRPCCTYPRTGLDRRVEHPA